MRLCSGLLALVCFLAGWPEQARAADDLRGVFEIASLGADRRVEVWLADGRFTAHRVLNPEFEGHTYKLEHLFVGKVVGGQIKGYLWVREEGMPGFEKLRAFVGSVKTDDKLMLDGLPIERQAEELTGEPPKLKPKKRRRRAMNKTSVRLLAGTRCSIGSERVQEVM